MQRRRINLSLKPIKLLNPLQSFGKARHLFLKLILFIVFLFIISFAIAQATKALKKSNYFNIKDIIINNAKKESDFSYLKGRNIFDINLTKESSLISELYPTYKKVRLIRVLPNRLFVDFIIRKPLAYVELYRYFCVDEDQVLFDLPPQSLLQETHLPVIVGLKTKIAGAKLGLRYNIKELAIALNILRELKSNNTLKDYKFKTVDPRNPASASIFLDNGLEIKFTDYNVKNKVNILGTLFTQINKDLDNIRYIDLRFKEPVIKFKDTNK